MTELTFPSYDEAHAYWVGKLVINFHSLEFCLRAFLQHGSEGEWGISYGTDIYTVPVGSKLPENAFTNWDSLGDLIRKYNEQVKASGGTAIDTTLVILRDALAHGRIASTDHIEHSRLLKFSKPKSGSVTVELNDAMRPEWFANHYRRVNDALHCVSDALALVQGQRSR